MGLAECVAAGDERDSLLVVHRHALERLADVLGRCERIRLAVRPFRIDVDQAHLHRAERMLELAVAEVALVRKPLAFRTPVDRIVRLPGVHPAAAETERLEAHGLEGDIAGQDQEVAPGDFPAVFLLDRPQEPTRLVEARVVRPAVEGRKALLAISGAAAAVVNAVGAGAVPGHPDEEGAVVAKIRRPPVLRIRHERFEVADHGIQVEAPEFLGVIERLAHRIDLGRVAVETLEVQLIRPPVPKGPGAGAAYRALAFTCHCSLRSCSWFLCRKISSSSKMTQLRAQRLIAAAPSLPPPSPKKIERRIQAFAVDFMARGMRSSSRICPALRY